MNNRKYPAGLFVIGFITNILFRFSWLFVPSVILLIIGIWVKPCLYVGLTVLFLDVILSLIEQIKLRQAFFEESDNPDFQEFQDALSKEGDWKENIREFVNQQMSDSQNEVESNSEHDE